MIPHTHLQTDVRTLGPLRCVTKRITVMGRKDGLAGINRGICW